MNAIEIAEFLSKKHEHKEVGNSDYIVYKEKYVIELLQKLGHPIPDFEGYAKKLENEEK